MRGLPRGNTKSWGVLFLLSVGILSAPPAAAQEQTLTGWFSIIVADYRSEAGLTATTTYILTEDAGEQHELLIEIALMQPLGGPVALNRQRVTVTGEWEQSAPDSVSQFWVNSIELAPLPSAATPRRPLALESAPDEPTPLISPLWTAVTGSQTWATILCRFADATHLTPHPVSFYEKMTGASYPGLGHYWKELSYGNIDLARSKTVGWYNLPQPRSYYLSINEDGVEDFELAQLGRIAEDCTAAADADVFFPDFDGINLVFNHSDTDQARSRGGSWRLTRDGQTRLWRVTWIHPAHVESYHQIVAHEMGHAFGLLHSSGPYGQDDPLYSPTTYDSDWDVMSGGGSAAPYPGYGLLGVHTIAYHKDFLGWVPAARKYVAAPSTTRTITLDRLALPGSAGYLMAQIPIGESSTDFYTVEARLFAGYDEEIPDEAIIIHKVDTTREDRLAQVVDVDNNGDPNDDGAMWTVGEIFTDVENSLQVSIDAATATGYRVTINTDLATFSTCIDFLAASSHIFGPREDSASVEVKAADDCDWSARSNTAWIRVTSGASGSGPGSVSYTVTQNSRATARIGTLTIGGWTMTVTQAGAGEVVFQDDMERSTAGWSMNAPWTLSTASARSGRQAWTDSPQGNYQNDQNVALWSPVIDLTAVDDATLTFWHRYDIASGDGGNVWLARQREDGRWEGEEQIRGFTGTQSPWTQASLDLTPFVGERIRLVFQLFSDASETADGWYIDDVAVFSSDFDTPAPTQARLENPSPGSFQSGIGIISGWACEAREIILELAGTPVPAAYGTPRDDTRHVCGDSNNGFSLLVNWNNLGPGAHPIRALVDGVEFARTTVRVTTLGIDFLKDVRRTVVVPDFPYPGDTTTLRWEESRQNFLITDDQPSQGGGYNRVTGLQARLENPSLGSSQSGIGIISGWACEAGEIVIELAGTPVPAAYGTPRGDTQGECGDSNNGFVLLVNWNNLEPGEHEIRALADGVEFARTTVRVTTLGVEFLEGVRRTVVVPDFPHPGETTALRWEEALQNFVIIP